MSDILFKHQPLTGIAQQVLTLKPSTQLFYKQNGAILSNFQKYFERAQLTTLEKIEKTMVETINFISIIKSFHIPTKNQNSKILRSLDFRDSKIIGFGRI